MVAQHVEPLLQTGIPDLSVATLLPMNASQEVAGGSSSVGAPVTHKGHPDGGPVS